MEKNIIENIIKENNLKCSIKEFSDFYKNIDLSELEKKLKNNKNVDIYTFDQDYKWVKIENPANWKYYYVFNSFWKKILQNIVPFENWLKPINDDNIDQVIENHVNREIDDFLLNEKLKLTIANFKKEN